MSGDTNAGMGSEEDYFTLLNSVKTKGARFLQEKYRHWMEYYVPRANNRISRELDAEKRRLLYLRMFTGIFNDYHGKERTGHVVSAVHPGIELSQGEGRTFDVLLRNIDGTSLFVLYLDNQNLSPKQFVKRISERFDFIESHVDEFRKEYGVDDKKRCALLLTEREKPSLRKGLQLLGSLDNKWKSGEIQVMELSVGEGVLHGFPSSHGDGTDTIGFPETILLNTHPIDLATHDYLLFEIGAVEGVYAEHLMAGQAKPKEMSRKEIEISLFRELGLDEKSKSVSARIHERKKAFAKIRMRSALRMALRFNIMEGSGVMGMPDSKSKHGEEKANEGSIKEKDPMITKIQQKADYDNKSKPVEEETYRLICQGSDLTMVKKNLMRKYLDGCAEERASPLAGKKAVEAYRRRYPRIDRKF